MVHSSWPIGRSGHATASARRGTERTRNPLLGPRTLVLDEVHLYAGVVARTNVRPWQADSIPLSCGNKSVCPVSEIDQQPPYSAWVEARSATSRRGSKVEPLQSTFTTRPFIFDAQPARVRPRAFWPTVLAVVAVSLWSGSVGCLWMSESGLVFMARRSRVPPPVPGPGLLQLRTTDGVPLDALAFTPEKPSAYWILFCPPSGRSIHGRLRPQLESLRAAGYNVLSFDYRGFGRNPGTPSESGVYEDAQTAYRHLTQQLGVAPDRIILAGRSLGSAVAIELATRVPSGGLLLLSAIDSVPATASRFYFWAPVSLLASQRFDSMSKAPRVTVPVVQVHSPGDVLVPLDVARSLFGRFPGRKVMLELPGGHNDVGLDRITRLTSEAGYRATRVSRADEALRRTLTQLWPGPL